MRHSLTHRLCTAAPATQASHHVSIHHLFRRGVRSSAPPAAIPARLVPSSGLAAVDQQRVGHLDMVEESGWCLRCT